MKKEVLMSITLVGQSCVASYLFSAGLRHAHSVLFSSDRKVTKVLKFPFWLNIFGKISIEIKKQKVT